MDIIIVGAGEIGRHIAVELSRSEHGVTLIERNPAAARELMDLDIRVLAADGTLASNLIEAGVPECDLFLAVTSENAPNLLAASMAKKMGAGQVIARVHPNMQREEYLFDLRGEFDLDYVFSSERLTAIELSKFIRNPESVQVEEIARGRVEIQEVKVGERCGVLGKRLQDIKFPKRTRVASVDRDGTSLIAGANTVIEVGDLLTVFGRAQDLRDLIPMLTGSKIVERELRVVIFGGGEYGFSLAQMLESWDCKVRIFEKDRELCEALSDRLNNTTVINIDATVVAELEEEQVGEVDFFVAATPSDEDNVMTCLQAHSLGAKQCLTLVHRADYAQAINRTGPSFGVAEAVSPREATLGDLGRFVTEDAYHLLRDIGGNHLLETRVRKGSIASGHKIKEIEWPEKCVLIARLHGIHAEAPAAEDYLLQGDHLYALVAPEALKDFISLVN